MQRTFYSYELKRDVTVRGMSTLGVIHSGQVVATIAPRSSEAAMMAALLECLRDGMVEPELKTNGDLLAFVRQHPKTAKRAFDEIQRMTATD